MPHNFLTCCFSCQRDNEGREEINDVGEGGDEVYGSSSDSERNTLENFGGARPRISTITSRYFRQMSQEPTLPPLPHTQSDPTRERPLSPAIIVADIAYDEEILSTLATHSTTTTTTSTTTTKDLEEKEGEEEEEEEDVEKFYSFKCLVCYKSIIPRQVILPCGHSQCCEACFIQMQKRYRRSQRYHLKTLSKESIRPGHDIHCPTCRQDGILCHLFLGEEDLTSEITHLSPIEGEEYKLNMLLD